MIAPFGCSVKWAVFSFLYFLKIKISKIYIRFKIFQKYPRSLPIGRQALSVFFFFKFAMRSLGKKRPCRPPQRATGACRPLGGRQVLFFQGPILSYSSVYSSSSSARSQPLTPTARNLSFIKSREKIARTSLISRALWNPQT